MNLGVCVSSELNQKLVSIDKTNEVVTMAAIVIQSDLRNRIRDASQGDTLHQKYRETSRTITGSRFKEDSEGLLFFDERVCVPDCRELKQEILMEAHESRYSIHPGEVKMYKDLRTQFWWPNMKK